MKISWNYLNQFIDLSNMNIMYITEKLTLAGIEVEGSTYNKIIQDSILEICLTTNRQDIKGIINIATEISAILDKPIIISDKYKKKKVVSNIYIIKSLLDHNEVDNFTPYLRALNFQINNTILDPINLINLKWGQQFKAYELTLQAEDKLSKHLNNSVNLETKLGKNNFNVFQELQEIINQKQKVQNVLILNVKESDRFSSYAYQDLFHILKLKTEQIFIPKMSGYNLNKNVIKNSLIQCSIKRIATILGQTQNNQSVTKLKKQTIINYLTRLNFNVENINNELKILVPHERTDDIKQAIDIVEEIGRIHGFNNFIDTLPTFNKNYLENPISKLTQKIRQNLRFNGLHEVINYSFQEKKEGEQYEIVNPLNQGQHLLRDNLIEGLIKLKKHNIFQQNDPFEIFEIGTVFIRDIGNEDHKESKHLCCLFGNRSFNQLTWQSRSHSLTWLQGKGQIEDLFEKLNASVLWSNKHDNNPFVQKISKYIHPTKSAYIQYGNKTIGLFSQLNYRISHLINSNYNIYFCEIDIIDLLQTVIDKTHLNYRYVTYPHYPKTTRDLSIQIQKSISMKQMKKVISIIKQDKVLMVESINVLNEYLGQEQSRTICFRINYRSFTKTLTNTEVETLENKIKLKFSKILKSKT